MASAASAFCQLSVSSSLGLQTDYLASSRHVVASDPKALPGSQAQRPGQPCLRRTHVRRCAPPSLGTTHVTNARSSHPGPRNALSHERRD